jgi:endo-1,4-beta-xylanase
MGAEYIDKAMTHARSLSADATVLINEFDIGFAGPKFTGLMSLVDDLQAREIPLDGIGFQLHLFTSFDQFEQLRENFAQVAARGLDIYITELDVSLSGAATVAAQADVYAQIVSICLEQERCKAIQTWGLTDQYSFRSIFDPLLFDRAYQAKPAYEAVVEALSSVD